MDVEKLKKVNQLATTLREKGLADGREEAAMLAGRMNYEHGDQGMEKIFSNEKTEVETSEPQQPEKQDDKQAMDEKKMLNILQKFADQFSQEVNAMNDKIKQQQDAIEKMAHEIGRLKNQGAVSQEPQQTLNKEEEQTTKQTQETQDTQKKEGNEQPRSGGYESDDVCIEKFFYFGQK
ncbi:MAG: hypothetical protein ACOCQX_04835 [Candidatus Nanoarchaeia archaeon]